MSYRDRYHNGPLAAVPQADRTIQAGPVRLINVSPPPGAYVEPPGPEYALHLLLRTPPLLQVGFNRRPHWLAVSPGAMLLAPPDACCEYVSDAAAHVLTLAIPTDQVEDFTQACGDGVEVRCEQAFREARLMRQIVRLWYELADEGRASRLLADDVMRALLETFAQRTGSRPLLRHGRERLSNHALRQVRDYVESNLADDLDVSAMADVAALSPAHFARAFAATVGMTPFRYVIMRRLARARELLERTDRSAFNIALDLGFKSPSHFTARFRREFGVTPRAIRPHGRRSDHHWDLTSSPRLGLVLDGQPQAAAHEQQAGEPAPPRDDGDLPHPTARLSATLTCGMRAAKQRGIKPPRRE
jgi:AraC family transcriptional regulator